MNANTMTKTLADAIETDLASDVFKQANPEGEVERLADLHRRGVLKYTTRMAVTKRELRETISKAALEALAE